MDRIDRKEARGAGLARIATLAGLLFTAVAALATAPLVSLAVWGALVLTAAAVCSLAAAWTVWSAAAPAAEPVPLRIRSLPAPLPLSRD